MFAVFRSHPTGDLAKIGEAHMQHDLASEDRSRLRTAARKVSVHASLGSILGLGVGLAMAWRIRANRMALYDVLRTSMRPTEVVFASGQRGDQKNAAKTCGKSHVKCATPALPTGWGDAATFGAFSLGGMLLGGETGFLTGTASATRLISKDAESQKRIESAFRKFQVDVLKREITALEGQGQSSYSWENIKDQASGMSPTCQNVGLNNLPPFQFLSGFHAASAGQKLEANVFRSVDDKIILIERIVNNRRETDSDKSHMGGLVHKLFQETFAKVPLASIEMIIFGSFEDADTNQQKCREQEKLGITKWRRYHSSNCHTLYCR
ncbi:hypothetical protein B0T26DRAFT_673328 [Lasiosphaeria miniovina]|uniref:Uncharacterized protein n=1 Tax=Lasiosphaeria miniovina TaxID=1954250 RepID=A0AA40B762_9PEZI|nr:uncharacterized protein B0T26DRAFT_673328 [Lasiosphaeria miniovina]KAK0728859.1 hypothetical protein B0T26DRAFT_673328 [Lasiosphaeria miniovina]